MKFLITGASGDTGRECVSQALSRGHEVRALEPKWTGSEAMPPGAELVTGDVLKDDLAPHVQGCDAVISALGLGFSMKAALDPPPLYTEGVLTYLKAMRKTGVKRLIVISASFVASRDRGPIWFRAAAMPALDRVFRQMGDMERILRSTDDIDWTAVRPGWLLDGARTGDYTVTPDVIPRGLIRTRHADLADFMLTLAEGKGWNRQTPAIARKEPFSVSSPLALLRELAGR